MLFYNRDINSELDVNSQNIVTSKMRLLEKLLDIAIKDNLSHKISSIDNHEIIPDSERFFDEAQSLIKEKIKSKIDALSSVCINKPFISALNKLAQSDDETSRQEVKASVNTYIDSHIAAAIKGKNIGFFLGVDSSIENVKQSYRNNYFDNLQLQKKKEAGQRKKRLQNATSLLKKNVGDLSILHYITPVKYMSLIGKNESEIATLRKKLSLLRVEEDKFFQEYNTIISAFKLEEKNIRTEMEEACMKLAAMEREIEARQKDLKELSTQTTKTNISKKNIKDAQDDEKRLSIRLDELECTKDLLLAERKIMSQKIDENVHENNNLRHDLQDRLNSLEHYISECKYRLYDERDKQISYTHSINDLRHRILNRREDVHELNRKSFSSLNVLLAQIGIERELQSIHSAFSIEIQRRSEQIHKQATQHIQYINEKALNAEKDIRSLNEKIGFIARKLADFRLPFAATIKNKKLNYDQLMKYIEQVAEWERQEYDAISISAQTAARIGINMRENEKILRQLSEIFVLQEDLSPKGIHVAQSPFDYMQFIRDNLFNEAISLRYKESKYDQLIHLLSLRINIRESGKEILPLSSNRHIHFVDKKKNSSHKKFTQGGKIEDCNDISAFHKMVIQFIKHEIQSLYDSNQITKRRFIDVVSRVSSWFIAHHLPKGELSQNDIVILTNKIQEVLASQDEKRLQIREKK